LHSRSKASLCFRTTSLRRSTHFEKTASNKNRAAVRALRPSATGRSLAQRDYPRCTSCSWRSKIWFSTSLPSKDLRYVAWCRSAPVPCALRRRFRRGTRGRLVGSQLFGLQTLAARSHDTR
jgi:hypothetical protein